MNESIFYKVNYSTNSNATPKVNKTTPRITSEQPIKDSPRIMIPGKKTPIELNIRLRFVLDMSTFFINESLITLEELIAIQLAM